MPTRSPKRETVIDLGGQSSVVVGVPFIPPSEGGDDLAVTEVTGTTTLTTQGIYVATGSSQYTITLPLLSSVPADGWRIQIKRRNASNQIIVATNGSDTFEDGTTSKTLFQNYTGFVCFAYQGASDWSLGGRLGAVT